MGYHDTFIPVVEFGEEGHDQITVWDGDDKFVVEINEDGPLSDQKLVSAKLLRVDPLAWPTQENNDHLRRVLGDIAQLYPFIGGYTLPVTDEGRETLPALLTTSSGETVLYANKTNIVHGLPGTCKTWVAMLAASQTLSEGKRVIWWDFEDTPDTLAARARTLGCLGAMQDRSRFLYLQPAIAEDEPSLRSAQEWVQGGLVVIDAAESAGCPSDGAPINEWWCRYVTPWREAGAGVLILDHEPKRKEGRPRGPIGSVHKLSRIDGCALRLSGTAWTKRTDGTIYLAVHKDRPGDLPAVGKVVAVAIGSYDHNGAFRLDLHSPRTPVESKATEASDQLADELLRAIAAKGDEGVTGWREVRSLAKASNKAIEDAIGRLVEAGLVTQQTTGRGIRWVAVESIQDTCRARSRHAPITVPHRDSPPVGGRHAGTKRKGTGPRLKSSRGPIDTLNGNCEGRLLLLLPLLPAPTPRGPLTRASVEVPGTVVGRQTATHNGGRNEAQPHASKAESGPDLAG